MALRDEYYILKSDGIKIIKGEGKTILTRVLVNRIFEEVNGFSVHADILNLWKFKSFFIEIGGDIRHIEPGAFRDCEFINKLKIVINDNTSEFIIGNYAFFYCVNLENVEISANKLFINKSAFSSCTKLKKVKLSCNEILIHQNVFMNCSSIENIIIPNKVIKLDAKAFWGCTAMKKIYIPKSYINCPNKFYATSAEIVLYDETDDIGMFIARKPSFNGFNGVIRPNLIANKKNNKS